MSETTASSGAELMKRFVAKALATYRFALA
jgi:hypothetical protein